MHSLEQENWPPKCVACALCKLSNHSPNSVFTVQVRIFMHKTIIIIGAPCQCYKCAGTTGVTTSMIWAAIKSNTAAIEWHYILQMVWHKLQVQCMITDKSLCKQSFRQWSMESQSQWYTMGRGRHTSKEWQFTQPLLYKLYDSNDILKYWTIC